MAVTLTRAYVQLLKDSDAADLPPTARFVGWVLCDAVGQDKVEAGYAWECWPSRAFLAAVVGVSERQISRSFRMLEDVGLIRDTEGRRGRGIVIWEVSQSCLEMFISTANP